MQTKTINLSGIGDVLLERSPRAKRINLSVKPFKGVRIAVPFGVSFQYAVAVAAAKAPWIKKHLGRMALIEKQVLAFRQGPLPDPEDVRRLLTRRLIHLAALHGLSFNKVFFRNQKTRWGSCSNKNNISLNMNLIHLPGALVDYVIVHELVHTRIKNHSQRFWDALAQYLPNARELDKELNQYWMLLTA